MHLRNQLLRVAAIILGDFLVGRPPHAPAPQTRLDLAHVRAQLDSWAASAIRVALTCVVGSRSSRRR
jgi:hypothetical protein